VVSEIIYPAYFPVEYRFAPLSVQNSPDLFFVQCIDFYGQGTLNGTDAVEASQTQLLGGFLPGAETAVDWRFCLSGGPEIRAVKYLVKTNL
jgi:hypothetical protein